ncbi:DUF2809 domain-containing protein [Clostridium sp. CTA-5]
MVIIKRNMYIYLILTLLVMVLGLLSRKLNHIPMFLSEYSGDTLWSLMIFLLISFIFNKKSTKFIANCSIVFSYSIELSQLYHASWIDAIRSTTLGGLVLGFGFLWSDILCYTVGILIGVILDKIIGRFNNYIIR